MNEPTRDDCTCRTDYADQVNPSCPLHSTYTAAEVKVLTEAALRLGRKEAGEEIAKALQELDREIHQYNDFAGGVEAAADLARAYAKGQA